MIRQGTTESVAQMAKAIRINRPPPFMLEVNPPPRDAEVEGLRERIKALERTVKERDLLVAVVSHELRTPLTTIFGNASILQGRLEDMDADSRTRAISDIRQEAERLNGLVENMLLLARAGVQAPVPTEPVHVDRVLSEVVAAHCKQFSGRSVLVTVKPKRLVANGQPDYMKQVVQNLLSNAEKYSPGDEEIEVRASLTRNEVLISILDRGPGVASNESESSSSPSTAPTERLRRLAGQGSGLRFANSLFSHNPVASGCVLAVAVAPFFRSRCRRQREAKTQAVRFINRQT